MSKKNKWGLALLITGLAAVTIPIWMFLSGHPGCAYVTCLETSMCAGAVMTVLGGILIESRT